MTKTKISGTKSATEQKAEMAKRTARPKGGKPGQALTNQSAEYAPGELTGTPAKAATAPKTSDVIASVKNATDNTDYTAVAAPGHKTLLLKAGQFRGSVAKLAVVGGSYAAVVAALEAADKNKPVGIMANGVTGRDAPHSSKSVADNRAKAAKAAPAPVAKAAPAKAAKAAPAPKAKLGTAEAIAKKALTPPAKAAKAAPAKAAPTGTDRKYKATKKDDTSKPDSFRNYMIATIRAHGTTSAAKAAHAASGKFTHERLNFKWAHDGGYIQLADLA